MVDREGEAKKGRERPIEERERGEREEREGGKRRNRGKYQYKKYHKHYAP